MKIQRIVCFKFNEDAGEDAIKRHMDGFADLPDKIPQILTYQGGRAISGDEGAPPGYDTLHVMTFASLQDVDAYFHHRAHKEFIALNKEIWSEVLVLNAHLDEGQATT